ncbi:hypothetical protein BD779DRAFT_1549484 [Infundibulicybe gibba]|nr:hypothetical protein BD779DRAFT_1549484 [Infundibulicybe gibba]
MRFSLTKLFVIVSGIAAVQAQVGVPIDLTTALPPCARQCAVLAAQTIGCDIRDIPCICRNYLRFLLLMRNCIAQNCPASDIVVTEDILRRLCPSIVNPTLTVVDPTFTIGPLLLP